jgi:hypothetical protein
VSVAAGFGNVEYPIGQTLTQAIVGQAADGHTLIDGEVYLLEPDDVRPEIHKLIDENWQAFAPPTDAVEQIEGSDGDKTQGTPRAGIVRGL